MVDIYRRMVEDDERKSEVGLIEEELAFYDAATYGDEAKVIQDMPYLAQLVQQMLEAMKRNLKVDRI